MHDHDGSNSPKINYIHLDKKPSLLSSVLVAELSRATLDNGIFGIGSDGDVVISESTTLTSNKYYDTLTVNSGINLITGGYIIYANHLINNGIIHNNGANGGIGGNLESPGVGGAGGLGGYFSAGIAGANGGLGGNWNDGHTVGDGGDGTATTNSYLTENGSNGATGYGELKGEIQFTGGAGGTGGTTTPSTTKPILPPELVLMRDYATFAKLTLTGGAGGGGGCNNADSDGASGAGGGGGGGVVMIVAKTITNNGSIKANGGNGGNGTSRGTSGLFSGGGAGGNGGLIILIYQTLTSGTIQANGGSKGLYGLVGAEDGKAGTIVYKQI